MSYETSIPPPQTLIGKITSHPVWLALSADIFAGQIIASLIVLTFVAVFLLREWISQNARPGVFEDEELFPDMLPPANDFPPQPAPAPVAQNVFNQLVDVELEQQQQDALRVLERLQEEQLVPDGAERRGSFNSEGVQEQGQVQSSGSESGVVAMNHLEAEESKRRMETSDSDEEGGIDEGEQARGGRRSPSISLTRTNSLREGITAYPKINLADTSITETAHLFASPSEPNIGSSAALSRRTRSSTELLSSPPFGRRPPLPSSIPAFPGQDPLFTLTPSRTPLGSPSLATYRAPEELGVEAGSSGPHRLPKSSIRGVHEWGESHDKKEKGKYPETLSTPSLNLPINGSTSAREVTMPSQTSQVHDFVNGADELRDVPPQLLTSEPFQDELEQHRESTKKSDRKSRESINNFDLDTEMGHYFDTDENGTPESLLEKSELFQQPVAPELAAQARENDVETEVRKEDEDEEDEDADEDGDELWNDDGIEVEGVPGVPEQNVEGLVPPPDANPAQVNRRREQGAEGAAIPQDLADDIEGGVEDDMEGALEGCHLSSVLESLLTLF